MAKTIEQKMRDRENKVKRKAEIASFPLPIRTAFESAIDCIGLTDGCSDVSVLYQLRMVQDISLGAGDTLTIGELATMYLEQRLNKIKSR